MARILLLHHNAGSARVISVPWPVRRGPVHLAIAHALVVAGRRDWLLIAKGPLSGRRLVGSAVATVTAVSRSGPGIAEAQVEGPLAHGLARLGLDAIVVVGAAQARTGLIIDGFGDTVGCHRESVDHVDPDALDARDAPGTVWLTDAHVRQSADDVVITTGVFGMAGDPTASIVVNCGFPTTQGGLGAVLGDLRLDYLVLRGEGTVPAATPVDVDVTQNYAARIADNPLTLSEKTYPGFATWPAPGLEGYAASADFSGRAGAGVRDFDPPSLMAFAVDDGSSACAECPQWCLKSFSADPAAPVDGGRAHQLGISAAVLLLDVSDPATLVAFNSLCHELGIEHLSAAEALRGQPLHPDTLRQTLMEAIRAGGDAARPVFRVKGMPIPPFDPRGNQGLAVGYALNPTGPRYDVLEHDIDFEAGQPWLDQDRLDIDFGMPSTGLPMGALPAERRAGLGQLWLAWSAVDALGLCEFAAPPTRELTIDAMCSVVAAVEGAPFGRDELFQLGRLRLGFLRQLNASLGLGSDEDALPEHFFTQPVREGRLEGAVVDAGEFEDACRQVRAVLGWNDGGGVDDDLLTRAITCASELVWTELEGDSW
jgi:aldehyde:ferredoxin oxidoreductase